MTLDACLALYGTTWEAAPDPVRRLAARESVARELCDSLGWDTNATGLARTMSIVEFDALAWSEANARYRARRLLAGEPHDTG